MTNEAVLKNDPELQRVLAACLDYAQSMLGVICYSWVLRRYREMFGGWFHQSRLAELERLGFLAKDGEPSRGRRYYRIIARIELRNISGGPPKRTPLIEVNFPCPDCGQVLGPVTAAQLQATAWPYHALFSQGHRRALGYESRNG
jgi:hypothetical protein